MAAEKDNGEQKPAVPTGDGGQKPSDLAEGMQKPPDAEDDGGQKRQKRSSNRAATKPSMYRAAHAVEVKGRENMRGQIYFFTPKELEGQPIPKEQEEARLKLEDFSKVLRVVFQGSNDLLFQDYFQRLLTIAQGTFTTEFRPQALNDLPSFKDEIVQKAGGHVKSNYLRRMAIACGLAAVMFALGSFLLEVIGRVAAEKSWVTNTGVNASAFHTGILLAMSMVGLFFAACIRNLEPTFDTLMTPDADLAHPWVRVTFYGIAVLILALVFQARIVTVTIGNTFSTAAISENLTYAMIVGLLLGVAERALPKEVLRWSNEIITRSRTRK